MTRKNMLLLAVGAGVAYYLYTQSQAQAAALATHPGATPGMPSLPFLQSLTNAQINQLAATLPQVQ